MLKDALQWDPLVDVLLSRLPNRFIRPSGERRGAPTGVELVRELATGLDSDDAFLIFPEGGNYTDRRRARAIAKLREKGLIEEADKPEIGRQHLTRLHERHITVTPRRRQSVPVPGARLLL